MEFTDKRLYKYLKLFFRLGKHFSPGTGLLIMIRSYLTNNIYFYIFCIIFRALFLIMVSGNYINSFLHINSQKIQNSSKIFSLHYIYKDMTLDFNIYLKICSILYLLFIIRLLLLIYLLNKFSSYKNTQIFPTPIRYQVFFEHLIFLFFPYLLEFLAIPYYIYFGKNKFIIKLEGVNKSLIIIVMIINLLLIVLYNYNNFLYILYANKNYLYNDSNSILRTKNENVFENSFISYRFSKISIICLTIFQNVPLIQNIENYIGDSSIKYYKIIISIILFLLIIILTREKSYLYNYMNLINNLIAVFIIFCFYSIIIDLVFYLFEYEFKNWLSELIYIIEKFLLSFITYLLIIYRSNKYLQKQIINILFKSKNIKNKNNNIFINSLLYLNQIMIQIKEKDNHNQRTFLVNFLNIHIKKCNKPDCNCKFLSEALLKEEKTSNLLKILNNCKFLSEALLKEEKTSNLLKILNYLYESSFMECDYYNNYDLTILLAEHYCHLVNNPTLAFSFIISLLIRQKNKLSKLNKIILYELCEKYIYLVFDKMRANKSEENLADEDTFNNKEKFEYFRNYFNILKSSYYTKNLMNQYIKAFIKILKYKAIFEDTLIINYDDEENENIKRVQINFFKLNSNINSNSSDLNLKKKKKSKEKQKQKYYNSDDTSNIYEVIKILKEEKLCYKKIIHSIKNIDIFRDIPIFIIYKYYLFFDIFKNGEIPDQINSKLNLALFKYKTNYNNRISDKIYLLLKKLYTNQNKSPNSKFYIIFQFKNEITTKYFDEFLSLKLGYSQKDIIDENIDELMPKEFCNSHQNMVKMQFLGEQRRLLKTSKNYVFDASHTFIYTIDSQGLMIYSLSKYLIIILEVKLFNDINYIFMLNHNFDLIANSKNFTNDYLLNQKIFSKYKLSLLEFQMNLNSQNNKKN